jgi:Spy/CpxP family protein refolding chaperone
MKPTTKYILIGTALLAVTGTALAFNGKHNCDQRGAMMQGGQDIQMMQSRHHRHGADGKAQGRKDGRHSPMRAVYQLQDLTPEQRAQLDALRQTHQAMRQEQREAKQVRRAEMKKQVESILTEQQRETLAKSYPFNS